MPRNRQHKLEAKNPSVREYARGSNDARSCVASAASLRRTFSGLSRDDREIPEALCHCCDEDPEVSVSAHYLLKCCGKVGLEHVQRQIAEEMFKLMTTLLPSIPSSWLKAKQLITHILFTATSVTRSQRQEWVWLLARMCQSVQGLKEQRYVLNCISALWRADATPLHNYSDSASVLRHLKQ